jgi:hypothetical protein
LAILIEALLTAFKPPKCFDRFSTRIIYSAISEVRILSPDFLILGGGD